MDTLYFQYLLARGRYVRNATSLRHLDLILHRLVDRPLVVHFRRVTRPDTR